MPKSSRTSKTRTPKPTTTVYDGDGRRPQTCRTCPMHPHGEGFVVGEGPQHPHLVLLGEAPGAEEAELGRPFVGGAGRVLNALLHQAGVRRSECYLDNVLRCRPPRNKYPTGKTREKAEQCCRQYDPLQLQSANCVVLLGEHAMQVFAGKKGISKWRGSILLAPGQQ